MSKLNLSDSLTELPFNKIFFKLAVPNVCATFFAATTVIFDLWYIGKIGISELAGVAYIFPIYMLTSMLSNGAFGGAVSGATARAFGSKNITQAESIFRSAILIAFLGAIGSPRRNARPWRQYSGQKLRTNFEHARPGAADLIDCRWRHRRPTSF